MTEILCQIPLELIIIENMPLKTSLKLHIKFRIEVD